VRTIQMTLDDELVAAVDKVVTELKTTRSAFTRKALKNAIKQVNATLLEKKHKQGYAQPDVRHKLGKKAKVCENSKLWRDNLE
jgi:metal-responsive CopG/Arc/MetJ family transcriptional regulator